MRFSVGYDLGSFFSGLGEEGKHLSYLADYLIVTKHANVKKQTSTTKED